MSPGSPAHELVGVPRETAEIASSPSVARGLDRVGRRDWLALIGVVAAGIAWLIWVARDLTFFYDDWSFIKLRDLSVDGILTPHNEHLSATLVVLFRVLVSTVGTNSYWPYLAATFALNAIVAGLVYVAVRREASAGWALGAMTIMLLLGAGGYDILWAFQSGTDGAVAAGLAAVLIAPRRPWASAILLTIAVATSGVGLAFVAGSGVHLALTRPRALAWLAIPVVVYAAWFLTYGSSNVGIVRSPSVEGVPGYVAYGILMGAAAALGSSSFLIGSIALAALAILFYRTRYVSPLIVALFACDLAFLGVSGLVRAQAGIAEAGLSRYVYILAPAFLVAGAALLSRLSSPFRIWFGAAVLVIALVGNIATLGMVHDEIVARGACLRDTGWYDDITARTDC